MEIISLPLSDLRGYENNAKLHPQSQIEQIKKSIADFGFNDPIAIDENNVIIEGHGRFKAVQQLGWTEVPCIRLSHLNEQQKKAYILAHNKLTMNTDFDPDMLAIELDGIIDFDMEEYGFEIPSILDEPDEPEDKEDKDDWHQLATDKAYNLWYFDERRVEGIWQMPKLEPVDHIPKRLIGFNYAMSSKEHDAGLHFYLDDYQFERIWREPEKYIEIMKRYDCALTPSYSLYMDMARPTKMHNVFRARLLGQMMQDAGIVTIPIVYWAGAESWEYCFDGLPEGGTVSTLTMGIANDDVWQVWRAGMEEYIKRKHPDRILLYGNGNVPDFDFGDIEIVCYGNEVTERMSKIERGKKK